MITGKFPFIRCSVNLRRMRLIRQYLIILAFIPHIRGWNSPIALSTAVSGLVLVQQLLIKDQDALKETDISVVLGKKYDFIVVGGGSAGAVVASRLSENKDWNVLLLEAGGDESQISDIPLAAPYLQKSNLDWQYRTEPQGSFCLAMQNQQCNWPRGKILGGTSVLNNMIYMRGNRRDFDSWQELGNPGWGYDNILQYFKKSEDNRNPSLAKTIYHDKGGYLTIEEANYHTPLVKAFISGGEELGYINRDLNGEYQTGFMIAQGTVREGKRCSASKAFLRPVRDRENLQISMWSYVTKIHINPNTREAYGVEFSKSGTLYSVNASKEIIVSGGSINSPQLLMLSGIGPASQLAELEIDVIRDLPVGENLRDHVALGGLTFVIDKPYSLRIDRTITVPNILKYAFSSEGPLTVFGGIEGVGFVKTKYSNASDDFPDIQLSFIAGSFNSDGVQFTKIFGITDQFYDKTFGPVQQQDTFSILTTLLHPESVGIIKLRSSNPFDHPLIYANYFARDKDMKVLIEGVKIAISLGLSSAFKEMGSRFQGFPQCSKHELHSDAYYECMIRQFTAAAYHPVGTCKMGPANDGTTVVDSELRVHGVRALRVIDGSIIPTQISANPNAAIIMIGEKGADLVKNTWTKLDHEEQVEEVPIKPTLWDNLYRLTLSP